MLLVMERRVSRAPILPQWMAITVQSANELVHRIRYSATAGTYAQPVLPEEDGRVYDTSSD